MDWLKGRVPAGAQRLFWLILILVLASSGHAGERRISFKLTGGVSRSSLGDVNSYLDGYSRFAIDDLRGAGYVQDKAFESYHLGQDVQLEVMVPVTNRLSLGLGVGWIQIHKRQNSLSLQSSFSVLTSTLDHAVRAIPLTAALDWSWPIAPKWVLHIETGAGLYRVKFNETGESLLTYKTGGFGYTKTWEAKADASGLGLFAGIGLETKLTRNLSLVVEGAFRRARIAGFSGQTVSRFNNSESEQPFDLFYYEFYSGWSQQAYPALSLPDAERGYPLNVFREGAIDLSGWALKAGLRISL